MTLPFDEIHRYKERYCQQLSLFCVYSLVEYLVSIYHLNEQKSKLLPFTIT